MGESEAESRSLRAEQDREFEDSLRVDSQKVKLCIYTQWKVVMCAQCGCAFVNKVQHLNHLSFSSFVFVFKVTCAVQERERMEVFRVYA